MLETLLHDLPAELLQWKPGPDRWSVSEVLAHLADLEQVYSERVRRMIAENSPAIERYDQVGASAAGRTSQGSAPEHLVRFVAARRTIVAVLKSVPASARARTAKHSELGVTTLSQMLNEWSSHDLVHLRQMAELYRAHTFHPQAGPFQRYSNPKP